MALFEELQLFGVKYFSASWSSMVILLNRVNQCVGGYLLRPLELKSQRFQTQAQPLLQFDLLAEDVHVQSDHLSRFDPG